MSNLIQVPRKYYEAYLETLLRYSCDSFDDFSGFFDKLSYLYPVEEWHPFVNYQLEVAVRLHAKNVPMFAVLTSLQDVLKEGTYIYATVSIPEFVDTQEGIDSRKYLERLQIAGAKIRTLDSNSTRNRIVALREDGSVRAHVFVVTVMRLGYNQIEGENQNGAT